MDPNQEFLWLKWWQDRNKQNRRDSRKNKTVDSEEYQPENPIKAHIRKMRSPEEQERKSLALDRLNPSYHNEGSDRGNSVSLDLDQPCFDFNDDNEEGEVIFSSKKKENI